MPRRNERLIVALLALVFTWLFFAEYLPPFKSIHLWGDIEGYHYPLERYAFQSLKSGRLPQWDASIYCGISFAANVQAALFYPPAWLMYAAAWKRALFPFKALEGLVFAHVWLAFMFCYLWLRARRLSALACAFGAGVFAFGGYMVSQSGHVGTVTGLAWMPLGLWGIDQAVDRRHWRPLWKTAVASAMCFLAGYPATWVVFCATVFLFALLGPGRWRAAAGACAATAVAMLLSAVQLLPALEARGLMLPDEKYSGQPQNWGAVIGLFVPNWLDFNHYAAFRDPHGFYVYLGLPALFAIAWAVRRGNYRAYLQPAAVAAFCLLMIANPRELVYYALGLIPFARYVAQTYNFYEGLAAMAALVTALGLHDFLEKGARRPVPPWLAPAATAALGAWSLRQLWLWRHGGIFPAAWGSVVSTAIALALFAVAFQTVRSRAWMAAVLLIAAGVDYKVYGTGRLFNAAQGDLDEREGLNGSPGIDGAVYQTLWANRDFRLATDEPAGPHSTDLRMWGLATPQGFDPFLPEQYRKAIEHWVPFRTNRLFDMDLARDDMLQALGVRYVITHEGMANEPRLAGDPRFRVLESRSFYRVYDYLRARPPFGWEDASGSVRPVAWTPERRAFEVASPHGGRFFFVEQFYPGWSAKVDGRAVPIERWRGAFQAIEIPPGARTVVFEYRSQWLPVGAAVSLLTAVVLAIAVII
jgi:hypothetical protein